MGVDGGGARLQPDPWRTDGPGDGLSDGACRIDPRLLDEAPILRVVPAVNTPPGEVDDDVRAVDLCSPIADRLAIPLDDPPRSLAGCAAQYDDLMVGSDEVAGQQRADVPASARDDDLHVSSLRRRI